jgi:hypothetical protein
MFQARVIIMYGDMWVFSLDILSFGNRWSGFIYNKHVYDGNSMCKIFLDLLHLLYLTIELVNM